MTDFPEFTLAAIQAAPANEETILAATVSLEAVLQNKNMVDVGGHYSRPDVLQLHVNRQAGERVVFAGEEETQIASDVVLESNFEPDRDV